MKEKEQLLRIKILLCSRDLSVIREVLLKILRIYKSFKLDENSILNLNTKDTEVGESNSFIIVYTKGYLSKEETERRVNDTDKFIKDISMS